MFRGNKSKILKSLRGTRTRDILLSSKVNTLLNETLAHLKKNFNTK